MIFVIEQMNSEQYWDNRFSTNWKEYDGEGQTAFFAQLMCQMFPQWFVRKIRENKYTICDMGCALGDAVDVLTKYLNVDVDGADFSETAIKEATKKYPSYNFSKIDLRNIPEPFEYDILIASNVLEHFDKPWSIVNNMAGSAKKYIVLMMPYQEQLNIDEHVFKFDNHIIPMQIGEFALIYCNVIDGNSITGTFYPDQQVLLIYAKDDEDKKATYLSDICHATANKEKILYATLYDKIEKLKLSNDSLEQDNNILNDNINAKNKELLNVKEKLQQIELIYQKEKNMHMSLVDALNDLQDTVTDLQKELVDKQKIITELEQLNSDKNVAYEKQLKRVNEELEREICVKKQLEESLLEKKTAYAQVLNALQYKNNVINNTEQLCMQLATTKPFKLAHFLRRLKYQGVKGDKTERKKFKSWLISKILGRSGDFDRRYNPLYWIVEQLQNARSYYALSDISTCQLELNSLNINVSDEIGKMQLEVKNILSTNYEKFDVIILSVIGYDFRFQRPQHFATRFAENGHRVFYINADFHVPDSIEERQPGLFIVNLHSDEYTAIHVTDWRDKQEIIQTQLQEVLNKYCIRDAITIVDYPHWVYVAEYLRNNYGFKIITDYMDDFTGFLNPAEDMVRENCEYLLKISDQVVASSQFLYDIAIKYHDNIGLVRNGTEFDHFYNARGNVKHDRKVIGYYGAVAEWFDCDKVIYLAKNMPECDILIIGHVTDNQNKLEKCPNIKLLGEKPYAELPKYLKEFDVCLIPFDTSTDLIKATNPVKFYEYLSAGKKVVATEIPELEPFRDRYVYMSNDDEEFLQYVRLCLNGEDSLADEEACMQFAQENDWQHRYEAFAELCMAMVPKVSIIVLTYNNLKLNKLCIDSILDKTAYPNYELIIVDNCSTDGTREWLQEIEDTDPKLKVILNSDNKGFAAGNNVGIQAASGDYIVLLNNDTIVTRGWLTAMSKHLENDAELGMCGPVTNSIGNESKIKVEYHDIDSMHQFAYWYTTNHLNKEYRDIRVLALFCTMIKKKVIEECGMLDEAYKVGMFEDDDYAEAVKNKGYIIAAVEDAFIHHFAGASFKKLEDEKYRKIFDENKKIFEDKWNTTWVMHKNREGVEWDANLDIDILS